MLSFLFSLNLFQCWARLFPLLSLSSVETLGPRKKFCCSSPSPDRSLVICSSCGKGHLLSHAFEMYDSQATKCSSASMRADPWTQFVITLRRLIDPHPKQIAITHGACCDFSSSVKTKNHSFTFTWHAAMSNSSHNSLASSVDDSDL